MKMIDFARKGNLIRLYLGDGDDFTGDDWDDYPYEDNASTVYDEYVKAYIDYAIPFEYGVYEPCDESYDAGWCKNDMKCGCVPMFVIGEEDEYGWSSFSQIVAANNVKRIYMNEEFDKEDFKDFVLVNEKILK